MTKKILRIILMIFLPGSAFAAVHQWVQVDAMGIVAKVYSVDDRFGYKPPNATNYFDVTGVAGVAVGMIRNADGSFSPAPPPPAPTLDQRRVAAVAKIEAEKDMRYDGGFLWNGAWIYSDDHSLSVITGLKVILADLPAGTTQLINTMDKQRVPVDATNIKSLSLAFLTYQSLVDAAANTCETAINLSQEPETYTCKGWPQSYADYLATRK